MKSLSYLNKYLLKYKWWLLLGIVFVSLSNGFYVVMPVVAKEALDEIIQLAQDDSVDRNLWLLAFQIAGLYMLFSAIKGVFLFFTRQTIIKASRFIEYDLKNEIFDKYQELSFSFYKRNQTGDLINRISEDVSHVRMYLGPGIMYGVNLLTMFVIVIPVMWQYSIELTLYALAPLPLMSFLIYRVSARMNEQSAEVQKKQSDISTMVQESFSGINIIKTYLREGSMSETFGRAAESYKTANLRLALTNSLFMPTILFLIGLSNILAIYSGVKLIDAGEITEGVVLSFIFYINMLTWPMASLGWVTSLIQRAAASQERINNFLKEKEALFIDGKEKISNIESIEFKDVHFSFNNSDDATLKDVNVKINKGEKIGVVGKTGSGKSTFVNLILRHYDPESGQILVNGIDLKQIEIASYRKMIGAVPQEVFLFSDTINANIQFGLPESTPFSEVEEAAKFAHVHHNITDFEDQYDTILGERGINLSGGQKQRISLARAVIKKPDLLIFDDSLSAVDTQTEEIILNNIKEKLEGVTSIIIAHRLSSLTDCDKILVFDQGQIVETGNHIELLEKKGIYAEMHEKQMVEDH